MPLDLPCSVKINLLRSWEDDMTTPTHVQRGTLPRGVYQNLDGLKDDLLGRNGFLGRQTHLYRHGDPCEYRPAADPQTRSALQRQLSPTDATDPSGTPIRLAHNESCQLWLSRRAAAMPFYRRNLDGDEAVFVHRGQGVFETEFGPIPFEPGDVVVIPKSVTHRLVPDGADNVFLITETTEELVVPDYGLIGHYTPVDPSMIFIPEPEVLPSTEPEYEVRLKHGGDHASIGYDHNPCDVAGWRGDYFPWKYNIRDFKTLNADAAHILPSARTLLATPSMDVLLAVFGPHRAPMVPGVEKTPPSHRNADYDEVLFSHDGQAFGNPMPTGVLMHVPQGLHHGVPEAEKQRIREEYPAELLLDSVAVAIDCRARFVLDEAFVRAFEELTSGDLASGDNPVATLLNGESR
ncbi:homogentisate 1,2-dioxygenase [Prauserella endophytica]|uniref:Homogentisate 1,2-dioxygenase n=1 Tax=Prauserella endophytica TaxID=1592324 RepID=A0ABY2SAY6_9PSEU|nr:homogentisate 1,2-dioxygenase [Prauserella endophytica]TKG73134.1 homogentisate 1,2-dioxygenase [Prauserella endophytica]